MESLFFNTPTQRYQTTEILHTATRYLSKVDISNGIFFYHGDLGRKQHTLTLQNLDRMVVIAVSQKGKIDIKDHIGSSEYALAEESVGAYISSRQHVTLAMQGEVFILFVADFFLKHYLGFVEHDPVDYLYEKIQKEVSFEEISTQPLDALSLYIIGKIIGTRLEQQMQSLRCMSRVIELIIHRLSLLDMPDEHMDAEALSLATRAKEYLLKNYQSPPSIEQLAHLCATNETKLKKVFKKAYQTTIYGYVQRLRLAQANLLLREENLSVGEISKRVGYRHQGHFSKLFFSVYGVYPKDLKH